MGWLIGWDSKREVIQHLNKPCKDYKPLRHCVRGDTLWQVIETARGLFIGCTLLTGSKKDGYGYKDMEEASHPYRYHCPLGYLEQVKEVTCPEWRDKVRAYHAEQALKSREFRLTVGAISRPIRYREKYLIETVQAHFEATFGHNQFKLEAL